MVKQLYRYALIKGSDGKFISMQIMDDGRVSRMFTSPSKKEASNCITTWRDEYRQKLIRLSSGYPG